MEFPQYRMHTDLDNASIYVKFVSNSKAECIKADESRQDDYWKPGKIVDCAEIDEDGVWEPWAGQKPPKIYRMDR